MSKQETRFWSLVCEDSLCCWATEPVRHNHWGCFLEPISHSAQGLEPVLTTREPTATRSPRSTGEYRPLVTTKDVHAQRWRPRAAKRNTGRWPCRGSQSQTREGIIGGSCHRSTPPPKLVLEQAISKCGPCTSVLGGLWERHIPGRPPSPTERRTTRHGWGVAGGVLRSRAALCVLTVAAGDSVVCLSMGTTGAENHGPVLGLRGMNQRLFQVKSSAGLEVRLVSLKVLLALWVQVRPWEWALPPLPPDASLSLSVVSSIKERIPFWAVGRAEWGLDTY